MTRRSMIRTGIIVLYAVVVIASWRFGFTPGREIGGNFAEFAVEMLKILPAAFILIGLFEVWVGRGLVESQLGEGSGIRGYVWAVLLAATTVGGLYVAFPIAHSLYGKGAKLSVIFTYIGAAALCRIPMTVFEASFLGVKFTAIRLLVSLPLVVVTSMLLSAYLTRRGYRMQTPE